MNFLVPTDPISQAFGIKSTLNDMTCPEYGACAAYCRDISCTDFSCSNHKADFSAASMSLDLGSDFVQF